MFQADRSLIVVLNAVVDWTHLISPSREFHTEGKEQCFRLNVWNAHNVLVLMCGMHRVLVSEEFIRPQTEQQPKVPQGTGLQPVNCINSTDWVTHKWHQDEYLPLVQSRWLSHCQMMQLLMTFGSFSLTSLSFSLPTLSFHWLSTANRM